MRAILHCLPDLAGLVFYGDYSDVAAVDIKGLDNKAKRQKSRQNNTCGLASIGLPEKFRDQKRTLPAYHLEIHFIQ